jgi:NAD(P)-dependent dehydrogenase (short-subunit alcohol dehydrogenase family)
MRWLAAHGARVVVNDLAGSQAGSPSAVVEEIVRRGGTAIADGGDVTDPRGMEAMVARAVARWGASTSSSTTPASCATRPSPR